MNALIDGCGRQIDHLRISVTSACNLHCVYCRPSSQPKTPANGNLMTDAQRLWLITYLHRRYGLRNVRITGGEPLLHRTLIELIHSIRRIAPTLSIALTTNGQHLARHASELRRAGLDRLNVSLDSLDPQRYHRLTGGELAPVLEGIDAAVNAGFPPPRINMVVLRGLNDDEIIEMAEWGLRKKLEVRYLEAMPIGPAANHNRAVFVAANDIRQVLHYAFSLTPLHRSRGETAVRYRAQSKDCEGVVGIIAPVSERFCGQCRRIRVTADGHLYPCLLDTRNVNLRPSWAEGRFRPFELDRLLRCAVEAKQPSGPTSQSRQMVQLGG